MVNALDCIQAKPVSQRLKKKVLEVETAMRTAYPGEDDAMVAERVGTALEDLLSAKERATMLSVEKQLKAEELVSGVKGKRKAKRLLSLYEGDDLRRDVDFPSVHGRWDANRAILHDFLGEAIQEFSRRIWNGVSRNKTLQRRFEKEVFGESTGDPTAQRLAKAFHDMGKFYVSFMQSRGARMHFDPNRQFIVEHNSHRVARVDLDEWMNDILDNIDLSRMKSHVTGAPLTRAEMLEILPQIKEAIDSFGISELKPGVKQRVPFWQRLDESRFFIWKDHASWERYNKKYGFDDSFQALIRTTDMQARNMALIDVLGPDPTATTHFVKDLARKASNEAGRPEDQRFEQNIQRAYDIVSGASGKPTTMWAAEAGASTRNWLYSVLLGGLAPLAFATDAKLASSARKFNGISRKMQFPRTFAAMLELGVKGPKSKRADRALKLGIGLQSLRNSVLGSMRGLGDFDGHKWTHLLADFNFRVAGTTLVTDAAQYAYGFDYLVALTGNLNKPFKDFDNPRLAETLEAYGITEERWLKLSENAKLEDVEGLKVLSLPQMARYEGYDDAAHLLSMIEKEKNARAIITASPSTRRMFRRGTQPGSIEGELARFGTDLLSWPTTFMFSQIGAVMLDRTMKSTSKAGMIASTFVGLTMLGAMITQFRQVAAGRDMYAWEDPRLWMQAAVIGGGAGLVSDFLFREHYGTNDTMLTSMMGPGIPVISEALALPINLMQSAVTGEETNVGRDAVSLLRKTTPLSSVWYARTAMDRLIFDELQKWVDPEAHRSFRARRMRPLRDRQQEHWWNPGETSPSGVPFR